MSSVRLAPKLLALVPLALVAALGCAKTLPTQAPVSASPIQPGSGEWRVVDNVLLVTDGSGTMYMNETFPEAKALTQSFVKAMPEASARSKSGGSYRAGSIGFGGNDRIVSPLASFNRGALAAKADSLKIMGAVDGMGGRTPLHKVIEESGMALQGQSGPAAVVLFTDGIPDDPDMALAAGEALVGSHPGGVCIHAVQTGEDPEGTAFLQSLAGLSRCGSVRSGSSLGSGAQVSSFAKTVFLAAAPTAPARRATASACEGIVRLRGIEFEFDRADITSDSEVILDVAADQLKECGNLRVRIDGHTDSVGTEDYNQGLSERRANAVRSYFATRGLSGGRLTTRGFGESQPIAGNDTADGSARNRRVELTQQ